MIDPGEKDAKRSYPLTTAIGASGLDAASGYIREEFLPELQGLRGRKMYHEMASNDPTIGAVLFAITMLLRSVEWRWQASDPENERATEAAEMVEKMLTSDMVISWPEVIDQICSMFTYGFCVLEVLWKKRQGPNPAKPWMGSEFDDGYFAPRQLAIRSQRTIDRWVFDPEENLLGFEQSPLNLPARVVPIQRCLLFRTTVGLDSPEGRALDPATPVITPDGWRTMDDLQPGDRVFDDEGRIRYVVARQDWEDRPSYRLTFNDGGEIIADENHQWVASNLYERSIGKESVRTTRELLGRVKTSAESNNWGIRWAAPLDFVRQHLPVDPYYLGVWLGDGFSETAALAAHEDDADFTAAIVAQRTGWKTAVGKNGPEGCRGRKITVQGGERWASDGPAIRLRALGVIRNKHIPEAYLRGSIEQRMDLLAGLMDSDGHVDHMGRCEFTNVNRALVDGVAELVRGLGCQPTVRLRKRASDERQEAWAVRFTPADFKPFRLPRKIARCKSVRGRTHHYITSIKPVEPRRTVCIEVDGPSHLFLAGRSMVPTHNSALRNAYRPYYFLKRLQEVEGVGAERDLAGLPVIKVPADLLSSTDPAKKAAAAAYTDLVTKIRRDRMEGVVIPSDRDEKGNLFYELSLLSTGGSRQIGIDEAIQRYQRDIARSVLADFIFLGADGGGSLALGKTKVQTFTLAMEAYLNAIAAVVNEDLIPKIWALNGFDDELMPRAEPQAVSEEDLAALASFVQTMANVGFPIAGDRELEAVLRAKAELPPAPEDASDFAEWAQPMPGMPQGGVPEPVEGEDEDGGGSPVRGSSSRRAARQEEQDVESETRKAFLAEVLAGFDGR